MNYARIIADLAILPCRTSDCKEFSPGSPTYGVFSYGSLSLPRQAPQDGARGEAREEARREPERAENGEIGEQAG